MWMSDVQHDCKNDFEEVFSYSSNKINEDVMQGLIQDF